jgi:peptidoglycan lytic transglycosylase G
VEREDWFADTEGNLSGPGELKPATDEFGRDDPAAIERERRRREREQRRAKRKGRRAAKRAKPAGAAAVAEPAATTPPPASPPSGDGGDPAPRGPSGTYRRRRILALALVLVGALFAWFLIALFQPPPFNPGDGEGTVAITVPEGATADDIADLLTENDVVSNGTLFKWRLRLAGKSDSIQASRYVLAHNMSYGAAIDRLSGTGDKVTVTIPEGESRDQIAPQVKELGISGDYLAASASHQGFDPAQYGAQSPKSLEGFLFPATYDIDRGSDVNVLIGQQLDALQQNLGQVDLSYAKSKNLTPYDVLTIASMIDKEVASDKERPLVAAVIYNRLHKGMPLQIDATSRYQFHQYSGGLTQSQLSSPSAYNTRIHAGLPPTPIGNPGLASIKAAAHPAHVNYLYYVVKPGTCEHNFTASEAEFNKFAAEYQQALQAQGGSPTSC